MPGVAAATVTLVSGCSISLGGNQLLCGPGQLAVRAIDYSQRNIEIETVPKLLQVLSLLLVDIEVYCGQLVGPQALPVAQRFERRDVDVVDAGEHVVLLNVLSSGGRCGRYRGLRTLPGIAIEPHQCEHQDGEDHDYEPGSFGELGHREDSDHDRRQDSRGQVDHQLASPAGFAPRQVMFSHPVAGHRETGEHTDRVSGINALTDPPVTTSSATASVVTAMMPLENTNRWPRFISWRGRKRSLRRSSPARGTR